jgi:hypothetical protein
MGCNINSRGEVPGERISVIRDDYYDYDCGGGGGDGDGTGVGEVVV